LRLASNTAPVDQATDFSQDIREPVVDLVCVMDEFLGLDSLSATG